MAPKKDKAPPTSFLGSTKMTRMMLKDLEDRGVIAAGLRQGLQEQEPGDWASYWFYHKVPLDPFANLGETPKVEVERVVENEGYLSILREVSKTLGVCDVTEEFAACGCFPVKEG